MSLRARLLTGMAVVAVVLVTAAVFIARTTESHLLDQIDAQLEGARLPQRADQQGPRPEEERPSALYVAIVDGRGRLFTRFEPNLSGDHLPPPAISGGDALDRRGDGPFTVDAMHGGERYRVISRSGPRALTVVYALPLRDVDAAVRRLVTVEVVATLAALGVLGLVTWWVIRLGVRPIKRMTKTATAIAAGELAERVPEGSEGTEAGELAHALNRMLEIRTRSEEQLRRFVADASHELRTPITTIRGYAELHRAGGLTDADALAEAMRRTEQEATRMGTLVDDLLHLARLDQGRPLEREPVDLAALARDAVQDAGAVETERAISIEVTGACTVAGDEGRLRQVLGNLVTNALVHTDPGTPVEVRVRREADEVVVTVTDHGDGMPKEVADRAFERFFRADPARSRHRGGSGLGLAIVASTVAAHGGTVVLDSEPGRGTTVTVRLPAA